MRIIVRSSSTSSLKQHAANTRLEKTTLLEKTCTIPLAMAGLYLVPLPIAIPLAILIIALIPLTPLTWIWIVCTGVSRGIRDGARPADVVKTIGRRVGVTIGVPWVAVAVLSAMVVAQLVLMPFVFVHQLRAFRESLARAYEYFGEVQLQKTPTVDEDDLVVHGSSTVG